MSFSLLLPLGAVVTSALILRVASLSITFSISSWKSLPSTAITAALEDAHFLVAISAAAFTGSLGKTYSLAVTPCLARYVFQSSSKYWVVSSTVPNQCVGELSFTYTIGETYLLPSFI